MFLLLQSMKCLLCLREVTCVVVAVVVVVVVLTEVSGIYRVC